MKPIKEILKTPSRRSGRSISTSDANHRISGEDVSRRWKYGKFRAIRVKTVRNLWRIRVWSCSKIHGREPVDRMDFKHILHSSYSTILCVCVTTIFFRVWIKADLKGRSFHDEYSKKKKRSVKCALFFSRLYSIDNTGYLTRKSKHNNNHSFRGDF